MNINNSNNKRSKTILFYNSFLASCLLWTVIYKLLLATSMHFEDSFLVIVFWFPSVFIVDIIYFRIIQYCLMSSLKHQPRIFKAPLRIIGSFLAILFVVSFPCMLGYRLYTGFLMDVQSSLKMINTKESFRTSLPILLSQKNYFIGILLSFLFEWFAMYKILSWSAYLHIFNYNNNNTSYNNNNSRQLKYSRIERVGGFSDGKKFDGGGGKVEGGVDYEPLNNSTTSLPIIDGYSSPPFKYSSTIYYYYYSRIKKLLFWFIIILYTVLTVTIRPSVPFYALTSNAPINLLTTPISHLMPSLVVQVPITESLLKSKMRSVDTSFVKRKSNSRIKNVVTIFLETTRDDMFPFDYNSEIAKTKLTPEALEKREITPFFEEFVKKGMFSRDVKSVCSYTIKSLLSAMCSIYPFPAAFRGEHKSKLYKKCLPKVLQENGYETRMFQASTMDFEHQRLVTNMQGYPKKDIFGLQSLEKAASSKGRKARKQLEEHKLNYMGYDDRAMLPYVEDWIDEVVFEKGKPFQMTLLTNTNHHPWATPNGWTARKYSDDETLNDYLNTISYVDGYLKDLIGVFEKRGLLEDTIFTISGDHGLEVNEHGSFTTLNQPYENSFKVPFLMYTENEYWKEYLSGNTLKGSQWSLIDLVPTILDFLNDDIWPPIEQQQQNDDKKEYYESDIVVDYNYEGRSMLQATSNNDDDGVDTYSFGSPGFSSLIVRKPDGKKWVYIPDTGEISLYDLKVDPREVSSIKYSDSFELRRLNGEVVYQINWIVSYIKKVYAFSSGVEEIVVE